jgi:hypothetical protein
VKNSYLLRTYLLESWTYSDFGASLCFNVRHFCLWRTCSLLFALSSEFPRKGCFDLRILVYARAKALHCHSCPLRRVLAYPVGKFLRASALYFFPPTNCLRDFCFPNLFKLKHFFIDSCPRMDTILLRHLRSDCS